METLDIPPHPTHVEKIAKIIKTNYPGRDALGICIDLSADRDLVTETTPALAQMFQQGHESLPIHWRKNPEIWRTILSMSAHVDMGYIKAQILHSQRGSINPTLTQKAERLEKFITTLQERESPQVGEAGRSLR